MLKLNLVKLFLLLMVLSSYSFARTYDCNRILKGVEGKSIEPYISQFNNAKLETVDGHVDIPEGFQLQIGGEVIKFSKLWMVEGNGYKWTDRMLSNGKYALNLVYSVPRIGVYKVVANIFDISDRSKALLALQISCVDLFSATY